MMKINRLKSLFSFGVFRQNCCDGTHMADARPLGIVVGLAGVLRLLMLHRNWDKKPKQVLLFPRRKGKTYFSLHPFRSMDKI